MSEKKILTDEELKIPTGGEGEENPDSPGIRCPEALFKPTIMSPLTDAALRG